MSTKGVSTQGYDQPGVYDHESCLSALRVEVGL